MANPARFVTAVQVPPSFEVSTAKSIGNPCPTLPVSLRGDKERLEKLVAVPRSTVKLSLWFVPRLLSLDHAVDEAVELRSPSLTLLKPKLRYSTVLLALTVAFAARLLGSA